MDEIVGMNNGIYPDDHIVKYAKIKVYNPSSDSQGATGSKINRLIAEHRRKQGHQHLRI